MFRLNIRSIKSEKRSPWTMSRAVFRITRVKTTSWFVHDKTAEDCCTYLTLWHSVCLYTVSNHFIDKRSGMTHYPLWKDK
jgi:hypothetical protein